MRHKFKLESFLNFRKFKEDKAKLELANLNKTIEKSKKKVVQVKTNINNTYDLMKESLNEKTPAKILGACSSYIQSAKKGIIDKENIRIKKMLGDLNNKLDQLVSLKKDVKVIEKLKEKEFKKSKREYTKKLEDETDEMLRNHAENRSQHENR